MKTIDVQAKEWFDKTNGNSYFAARVTVDFGMDSEQSFVLPFQYGYEDAYIFEALSQLKQKGLLDRISLNSLREAGIITRYNIQRNCLKRDLKEYVIMKTTKVNFRRSPDGEIIAVILGTERNGAYSCLSLYDNMHFDAQSDWIKRCKNLRAKDGYNLPVLAGYLKARGYENVEIKLKLI